jgi:type 1 fimbria pilin
MLKPLLLLFSLVFSSISLAEQTGHGRVNIGGTILNPACTISVENAEQTVNLGVITQKNPEHSNVVFIYPFAIHFTSCILATSQYREGSRQTFSIKFDGPNEPGNRRFTLGEKNQGLAFEIHDAQNNIVLPGVAMKLQEGAIEKKILNYSLHLIKTAPRIQAGPFHSAVNFTLVYQ